MAYESILGEWVYKQDAILMGGRFYLAELISHNELIPKGDPLKKSEFILAQ